MTTGVLPFRPSERIRMLLPVPPSARAAEPAIPITCVQGLGRGAGVAVEGDFAGFHPLELDGGVPFAWTDGHGTVVCRAARTVTLRHVWIVVHATAPHGASVEVKVDGGPPRHLARVRGRRTVRINLGQRVRSTEIRLELTSPTFVPADAGLTDSRRLGVAIERIILGRSVAACAAAAWADALRRFDRSRSGRGA
ncbi:MAG: hypothetical protein FJ275_10320 [Planctomycetes bacterium]|nr:hypothetical protein [Planctomycetota bacterium]